jgi:hypothetical protein
VVEARKASPQGDVNFLEEIPALVGVWLVGARQTFQRAAVGLCNFGIAIRLAPW